MALINLAKNTAVYGLSDFLTKFFAFLAFPMIAAALSPSEFGYIELLLVTSALLSLFVSFGMNNASGRYYWQVNNHEKKIQIVTTGLAIQIIIGISVLAISMIIIFPLNLFFNFSSYPFSPKAVWFSFIVMTCTVWTQYVLDILRLHFAPWKFLILAVISRTLLVFLGYLAVVQFHKGIDGFFTFQTVAILIILPLAIWMIRKDLNIKACDLDWAKKLSKFGHPFIYAGLGFWILSSIDRWMLASMSSVYEVGLYSVAARFSTIALFVSTAFGQAWSPVALKIKFEQPTKYRDFYATVLLVLIFCMLLIGGFLSLFSGELISSIMPNKYIMSATPMAILCLGTVIHATQQITALGISLEEKTYLFAVFAWVIAVINCALNFLLIPKFGASGAAVSTFISYLFLSALYLIATQKLHALPISWLKLGQNAFLILLFLLVSVFFIAKDVSITLIVGKSLFFLVSVILAFFILPLEKIMDIKFLYSR